MKNLRPRANGVWEDYCQASVQGNSPLRNGNACSEDGWRSLKTDCLTDAIGSTISIGEPGSFGLAGIFDRNPNLDSGAGAGYANDVDTAAEHESPLPDADQAE